MRTCNYSDVLRGSAALAGFTMDDLGTPEFQLFRTFHDRRLQIAWEMHRWPELCPVEQRTFRAPWDETGQTSYPAGAQVLDPVSQMYYQALQATTVNSLNVQGSGTPAANDYYQPSGSNVYTNSAGYTVALITYNSGGPTLGWWVLSDPSGNQLYSNTTSPNTTWAALPTGAWQAVDSGTAPAPLLVTTTSPPPTWGGGTENSAYWAVCRTSYTADPFDPTAIYPVGTQVNNLLDLNFYQRIVDTGTPDEMWTPANWGLLTVFERNVALNQAWETNPIGEILGAWDKDPRITTKLVKLPFTLDQDGAQFVQLRDTFNYGWIPASTNFSYVWLLYRLPRPELTGDVLDLTQVYAPGQQVYYTAADGTGNFWTATATTNAGDTPDSQPGKWSLVALPYIFRGYLIEAGFADWLTSDGQDDKAMKREALAEAALELEADKLQRQQQQTNRFEFRR